MKIFVNIFLICFALYGMSGCKKDSVKEGNSVVYEETIQDIKKNEPVLLSFNNSNNTAKVVWTVTPSTDVSISTVGNNATIAFSFPGTYTVLATAGSVAAKYTVKVINVNYVDYGAAFNLSASKQVNINQNEAIVFTVHNALAGSHITWSVYSTAFNINIDTANNIATVIFTGGDFGVVTASDGVHTQDRAVWINDPAQNNPGMDTVAFILGEKLQLTPSVVTVGGSKQLVISATTTNNYHCPTDNILSFSTGNDYEINYAGVVISPQPCSPAAIASCTNSFNNIPAGTHDFTINFGNKTYAGTFTVDNAGVFTFNWPDTGSVSISPLVVR